MPPAFLTNNDSYHFFEATGRFDQDRPTGTNVADIQVILVREHRKSSA